MIGGITNQNPVQAGLAGPDPIFRVKALEHLPGDREADKLLLAGSQLDLFKALELLDGLVQRRFYIGNVQLYDLLACAAADVAYTHACVDAFRCVTSIRSWSS